MSKRVSRRGIALLVICLTVIGTVATQLNFGDIQMRVHQHRIQKEISQSPEYGPYDCISHTETSVYQYDAAAVDVSKLVTHLPLVIIETQEEIPGVPYYEDGDGVRYTTSTEGLDYTVANMKVISSSESWHMADDDADVTTQIKIRVRGNTSRKFDKKSYSVKTIYANGDNKDVSIMGMEENNDWVLHGPFLDKTLIRNYMAMNISGEIMDYAPDVRFCEVIIDGEYRGLYVMMETASRGNGRIDIEKPNKTRNVTGYIIELDNKRFISESGMYNFSKYTHVLRKNAFFDISYPGSLALTPELKDYIEKDVSRFEKALYSFDYDTNQYGYQNYVDMNEFVDYFILMEVFLQHDMGNLSTIFYKGINGKYKPCVWDFNNSLENVSTIGEDDFYIRKFVSIQAPWFQMFVKDEGFTEAVINRYKNLRKTILSDEYITKYIDETIEFLGGAVDRNYAVWGYSFDPANLNRSNRLNPDERNPRSYEEAIAQMENVLLERLSWLDENIVILKQYSHESAVKKFNH